MPGAAILLLPGVTRHRAEPQSESGLRHLCSRPRLQERSTGMASRSRPFASLRVRPHWEGVVGRLPSRMAVSTVGDETRGQPERERGRRALIPRHFRLPAPPLPFGFTSGHISWSGLLSGVWWRRKPSHVAGVRALALTRALTLSSGLISHGGDRHSRRGATDHALPVRPHPERSEGARPRGQPSAPLLESGPGTQVAQTAFRLGFRAMARHPRQ